MSLFKLQGSSPAIPISLIRYEMSRLMLFHRSCCLAFPLPALRLILPSTLLIRKHLEVILA